MLQVPMLHKNCMKFGTLNLKKVKVNGCKLSRNIINKGTLGKSFIWDAFEQEICVPSRSEYILLIVSRLGPPSVYDYWLAGYSLIISQKSITTSERMPEKIYDSELPRDFLARLGCSRNQEWSREFQRCHKKTLLHLAQAKPEYDKKKLECYALPLAISIALYYISLLIGFGKYSIEWRPPIWQALRSMTRFCSTVSSKFWRVVGSFKSR